MANHATLRPRTSTPKVHEGWAEAGARLAELVYARDDVSQQTLAFA
ncbi:MAG TPA: hypothetical protein VIG24_18060 [Acidimicrobiia bacterium]